MRRSRASGGSRETLTASAKPAQFVGEGIFVRSLFLILGCPLDQHPFPLLPPRPERRGSCPPWTIRTLFLLGVFLETEAAGKSLHVGAGNSSDRQLPRSGAPVSPPGLAPAPRSPPGTAESLARRERCGRLQDRLGRASPPRATQSRFGAGPSAELTHLAGAGRGGSGAPLPFSGSRQTFAGAQRASLGGPAKDARARRGEPGAAGGGGRPRVRAAGARGSRRGMGPAASSRRAARPPAGPAALSAPSRLPLASAAARRAGARRAARNCFHCKQKKATHDQAGGGEARGGRGAKGRDGAQGAEGAGERENVGRAAGGLGRRVRTRRDQPCLLPPRSDRPLAQALPGRSREGGRAGPPGFVSRGTAGHAWPAQGSATWGSPGRGRRGRWGQRRTVCLYPGLGPRGRAGFAPLATCLRNATTPSAYLTWLESKNKKNYDAGEAGKGEKRFHFSPTKASWRDSQGLPRSSPSAHLVPREKRHKGTAVSGPGGRSPGRVQTPVCQGREGGHYGLQRKSPILKAAPVEPL